MTDNTERDALVALDVAIASATGSRVTLHLTRAKQLREALAAPAEGGYGEAPMGAIENGRTFADRLESSDFDCQAGKLLMCSDWQEFRRCFEWLAEWAMHEATPPAASVDVEKLLSLLPLEVRSANGYDAAWAAGFNEGISQSRENLRRALIDSAGAAKGGIDVACMEMGNYTDYSFPQPAEGDGAVDYEFQVWQNGEHWAGGSASTLEAAQAEARHYAMMYGQDGPVEVRMFEKREITAALAAAPAAPRVGAIPLNDDTIDILGRPNFACRNIAILLRSSGADIPKRSENEQAATLAFLLNHYLANPKEWRIQATKDLQARAAALATGEQS